MKMLLTLVLCSALLSPLPVVAGEKQLTVDAILKNTDASRHTAAEIREYSRKVKGQNASGKGRVVNVLEGRRDRHRVTVILDGMKNEKGFNVVLYTSQNAPAELRMNDRITFTGEVGRISTFRGTSVDIIGTYAKAKAR